MLILASKSPRRRQLLACIRPDFRAVDANADETLPTQITPYSAVARLSRVKARAAQSLPDIGSDDIVIGADTLVALDGEILGKPVDEADAVRMLKLLSGQTHTVFTGVTVLRGDRRETFVSRTRVTFYPLTDDEIDAYVRTGDPMDKAGAYGIQERGCFLVKKINGDFYTVMGLPVAQLERVLRHFE